MGGKNLVEKETWNGVGETQGPKEDQGLANKERIRSGKQAGFVNLVGEEGARERKGELYRTRGAGRDGTGGLIRRGIHLAMKKRGLCTRNKRGEKLKKNAESEEGEDGGCRGNFHSAITE